MPTCPRCGLFAPVLYRCDKCGDIRCNTATKGSCGSPSGPGRKSEPVTINGLCKICRKGRYRKI